MHDDGTLVHRGEIKAIINGCTDGEKKIYCFASGCLRRVAEHHESELNLNSNQNFNNNNIEKNKRYQMEIKEGKYILSF